MFSLESFRVVSLTSNPNVDKFGQGKCKSSTVQLGDSYMLAAYNQELKKKMFR